MSVKALAERLGRELRQNNIMASPSLIEKSLNSAGFREDAAGKTEVSDQTTVQKQEVKQPSVSPVPMFSSSTFAPFMNAFASNDNSQQMPNIVQIPAELKDYALERTQKSVKDNLGAVSQELINVARAIDHVDFDISKEDTQQTVAKRLAEIVKETTSTAEGIAGLRHIDEKILTDINTGIHDVAKNTTALDNYDNSFAMFAADVHQLSNEQIDKLEEIYLSQREMVRLLDEQLMRDMMYMTRTEAVDRSEPIFLIKESFDRLMKTIKDGVFGEKPAGFTGFTGQEILWKDVARDAGPAIKAVTAVIGFFKKIGIAVAVGLASLAVVEGVMNPDRITQYADALKTIYVQNIMPTFQYLKEGFDKLYNEAILPMVAGFEPMLKSIVDWWKGPGESAVLSIGSFVNDVLIYIIGTALPASFAAIGTILANFIETFSSTIMAIKQILFGKDGVDPMVAVFQGFQMLIDTIVQSVVKLIDTVITFFIRIFKIDDLIGMKKSESFYEFVERSITELTNAFLKYVVDTTNSIIESIVQFAKDYNPIDMITNAMTRIVEAIMDMIPSYNDIVRYVNGMLDKMYLPQGLIDAMKLDYDLSHLKDKKQKDDTYTPPAPEKVSAIKSTAMDRIDSVANSNSTVIIQDNRRIDASTRTTSSAPASVSTNSGIPSTRPEPSRFDQILYNAQGWYNSL